MHGDLSYFDVADTSRRAGRGQMGEEKGGSGLIYNTNTAGEHIFLMLSLSLSLSFFFFFLNAAPHFRVEFLIYGRVRFPTFDSSRDAGKDDNNNTCMCV